MIASPLLFAALAGSAGAIHGEAALRIVAILLLPFVAGQFAQRWFRPWVLAHRGLATFMDRTAIAIAVIRRLFRCGGRRYLASFSTDARSAVVFALGRRPALRCRSAAHGSSAGCSGACSRRPDHPALSGAQKSIAVGAPLAATLFPPATAGMVLVPILVYHMAQLILSAWIAPVLNRAGQV